MQKPWDQFLLKYAEFIACDMQKNECKHSKFNM